MYCKRCGRKLDENSRFCDRCGKSVKTNSAEKTRKKEIEELAQSRIKRNNKLKEQEIINKPKKEGISDRIIITIIVIVIAAILVASMLITYNLWTNSSNNAAWRSQDGTALMNATPTPEAPEVDNTEDEPSKTPVKLTGNINEDGYSVYEFDGKEFLYPSVFKTTNTGELAKLRLVDSEGEGTIELNVQNAVKSKAHDLMLEYAKDNPENEVVSSRAGADWYIIDIENAGLLTHRKCVISNGLAISYDFTYNASSRYIQLYEQYIEYMDEAFNY